MSGVSDQTYWILDERQLLVLASQRRHDIGDVLAASGPMSIRELAQHLGVRPTGLYHHLEKLLEVGLVQEAGSRVVNRRREQLYKTPARRMRLARALAENKHPEALAQILNGMTRQMSRDFERAMKSGSRVAEGEERNFGFFRLLGRLSPAQLARVNANLAEILEVFYASADNDRHPVVSLGWVMAPVGVEDETPPSDRTRPTSGATKGHRGPGR